MSDPQKIEFDCPAEGCGEPVRFNLDLIRKEIPEVLCPACGKTYSLSPEAVEKLEMLRELIAALRKARPILGEAGVGIEVGGHKVVVPYYLLLTRMTSELALKIEDGPVTFRFVVEP